jgi:hypothetical protein
MKEDKLRLQKFLDTMPTDMANKLTGRMLYRRFTPELLTELESFKENFIRDFHSDFSDPEIKKTQEKFYQSLKELDWFVLMNFKRSTTTGDYHLRTTIQRGGEKWNELVSIRNEFLNDYKKLVSVANEKLSSNESKNSTAQQSHNVAKAEYKNDILYFCGKEINFTRKENQKDLLNTLFKKSNKNWSYDEIQEDWDEIGIDKAIYPKNFWRKFYSAGDDINHAIAEKTQIEDFIIKNTKEIKINPKYV